MCVWFVHFIIQDGIASYECICGRGWGGANCEDRVGGCNDQPCLNGATCSSVSVCVCVGGEGGGGDVGVCVCVGVCVGVGV